LTLTHPLLMPLFAESWRAIMLLWGSVGLLAAILWWAITAWCGQRVPGFPEAPGAADPPASEDAIAGRVAPSRSVVMVLLAMPAVRLVLAMSVGVFLINHGLSNWLPELLRSGGMSITAAGYWAALPMLVGILGSLTIPRLATPERRFRILAGLCLAGAVSCLLLLSTAPLVLTGALLLQGLVRASLMTVLILTLMELPGMNPRRTGTASGLFFSFAEVGGVLGPLGLGLLYDTTGSFTPGLIGLAAVAAGMMLATARLARLARRAS
ncbi:MAG: MFS transporter, partial [Pseudomonadales bacterium]|nr:MFS transporter [Pseudomonadales bacterium]